MSELRTRAIFAVACATAALSACMPVKEPVATDVMSRVHVGMTKDDVIDRIGPADGSWGPWHSQCLEYSFNKYGTDRYAIYFNNQHRAIFIDHASCNVKRAEELGLRG